MKKTILKVVNNSQGVNNVDLALKVMAILNPQKFDIDEFSRVLTDLVISGEVLEIEYNLPTMDYRIKSFYLPKGTKIYMHQFQLNHD